MKIGFGARALRISYATIASRICGGRFQKYRSRAFYGARLRQSLGELAAARAGVHLFLSVFCSLFFPRYIHRSSTCTGRRGVVLFAPPRDAAVSLEL